MKKVSQSFIGLFIILAIIISVLSFPVSASSAVISLSPNKKTYDIGEQVTLNCTVNSDVKMYSLTGTISYNNSVVQYVSGADKQGDSSVKNLPTMSGETTYSYSVAFKVIAEGDCYFRFDAESSDGDTKSTASAGWTITCKTATQPAPSPTPSSNANLASLRVSGTSIFPAFSANTTKYSATVDNTVSKVTISASVADAGATVDGAGSVDLKVGNNSFMLTVTAASGAKKIYTINVKRLAVGESTDQPVDNNTDLLSVTVDNIPRRIMSDITNMVVPQGFVQAFADVSGVEVGVLEDVSGEKKMVLYYLTAEDGSDADLYIKTESGDFERIKYLNANGKMYIVCQYGSGYQAPSGYYEDYLQVTNGTVTAFKSHRASLLDFYIIYCFVDGNYGFYRFDSKEFTIQREPDFELQRIEKSVSSNDKSTLAVKLSSMNSTGKIAIVILILIIICIISLVVLLIIKFISEKGGKGDNSSAFSPEDDMDFILPGTQNGSSGDSSLDE